MLKEHNDKDPSPQPTSKPLGMRPVETTSDIISSSPGKYHGDAFSTSPFSDSSIYTTASSSLSTDSSYADSGAFAPEYHRDSSSFAPDSAFRETTFSSPEVLQFHAFGLVI
jgi:hypothetical protein